MALPKFVSNTLGFIFGDKSNGKPETQINKNNLFTRADILIIKESVLQMKDMGQAFLVAQESFNKRDISNISIEVQALLKKSTALSEEVIVRCVLLAQKLDNNYNHSSNIATNADAQETLKRVILSSTPMFSNLLNACPHYLNSMAILKQDGPVDCSDEIETRIKNAIEKGTALSEKLQTMLFKIGNIDEISAKEKLAMSGDSGTRAP